MAAQRSGRWTEVSKDSDSGLPTMLVQAIVTAVVFCIGEFICAPIYVALTGNKLALVPWAMVACLLAVAFTYVVGFALLWSVESLGGKIRGQFLPLAYGIAGMLGFTLWGVIVVAAFLNSIIQPLGMPALHGGQLATIGANSAALGLAAFFVGAAISKNIAKRRAVVIVLGLVTLVCAAFGAFYLVRVYGMLY